MRFSNTRRGDTINKSCNSKASPAAAGRACSLERARRSRASSVPSPLRPAAALRTETYFDKNTHQDMLGKAKLSKTLAVKRSAGMREAHLGFPRKIRCATTPKVKFPREIRHPRGPRRPPEGSRTAQEAPGRSQRAHRRRQQARKAF